VLFPRVRARTQEINGLLDDLVRQHQDEIVHMNRLKTLLGRMAAEVPGAAEEFAQRVATYAGFHAKHMNQKKTIVLHKAAEVLQPGDWEIIAQAFEANDDPLSGKSSGRSPAEQNEWFRSLYRRIVMLVPEPWGVGERHAA
jgi:hemerythrin-like domain-containing protein